MAVTLLSIILCALVLYLGFREQRAGADGPLGAGVALAVLGVAIVTAILAFWPVIERPGWPYNHEAIAWGYRVTIFAKAAQAGDPLPLWNGDDVFRLGSAAPLLYHRLFNVAVLAVYLVTGSMKGSVLGVLCLLTASGVLGMYRAFRAAGVGATVAILVAAALPHVNYAATNWLVRGAMAEYAAFCIVPWALWWSICLLRQGVFKWQIVIILTALVWAHTLIAYFSMALLGLAFLLALVRGARQWRALLLPALGWAMVFAVVNGPFLALIAAFGRYANLAALSLYTPTNEFRPLMSYFQDRKYSWGSNWRLFTVQLDTWLMAGAVACAALCVPFVLLPPPAWAGGRRLRKAFCQGLPVLAFAALLFVLFFGLQLPISAPFYEHVPGAAFVQFPWRLLTLLSALLLLLLALAANLLAQAARWLALAIVAGAVVSTISLAVARPLTGEWFSAEEVESPPGGSWVEYWPRPLDREYIDNHELHVLLSDLVQRGVEQLSGAPCEFAEQDQAGYLRRAYQVSCPETALVALPLAYSGFEQIKPAATAAPLPHYRTDSDPRVRVQLPPGSYELEVCLPTLGRIVTAPLGGSCAP